MSVCGLWRDIAIGTPAFWSELFIKWEPCSDFPPVHEPHPTLTSPRDSGQTCNTRLKGINPGHSLTQVKANTRSTSKPMKPLSSDRLPLAIAVSTWLGRAKNYPLTLVYDFTRPSSTRRYPSPKASHKFLEKILKPYTSRVRNLSLTMPPHLFRAFCDIARTSVFPALELVRLNMATSEVRPPRDAFVDWDIHVPGAKDKPKSMPLISFSNAPYLTDVLLESSNPRFGFISSSLVTDIPYSRLAVLSIIDPGLHPAYVLPMLSHSLRLVQCTLTIGEWAEPLPPMAQVMRVMMRRLDALSITFVRGRYSGRVSPFFDCLTLPALTHLNVSAPHANDNQLLPALTHMVSHSSARIRFLALTNLRMKLDPLVDFFHTTKDLETLILDVPADGRCYGLPKVFESIAYPYSISNPDDGVDVDGVLERILLPNLVSIFISDNIPSEFSDRDNGNLAPYLRQKDRIDVVQVLKDMEVLRAIATRCWRAEDPRYAGVAAVKVEGGIRLQKLKLAALKWRNAPIEWCENEERRSTMEHCSNMQEIYQVRLSLPIEPRTLATK